MNDSPKYMVVVGISAGGIRVGEELVKQLSADMDAAFFLVLHLPRKGVGDVLFQRLQQHTPLPFRVGEHGISIEKGVVYIAPPDHHLLLGKGHLIIGQGAPENRWRPSINNLFRSAAAPYSSRVIGIILTGLFDDGTSGMASIKRCGGVTIVQDPNEADYSDMPLSVLNEIELDHEESLTRMGPLLRDIIANREPPEVEVPQDIQVETDIDQRVSTRLLMKIHFWLKEVSLSEERGFGLDASTVTVEKFPLVVSPVTNVRLKRVEPRS